MAGDVGRVLRSQERDRGSYLLRRPLPGSMAPSTRNRVVPAGAPDEAAFEIVATPTPLQVRALALLNVTPTST